MAVLKKIFLGLLIVFVILQFIRPERNINSGISANDLTKTIDVPDNVQAILKNSCYDCHSNNTRYPWYMNIQPMGWIMANHVNAGKKDLNFSEFGNYTLRRQKNKLRGIEESIEKDYMPVYSYTILHADAKLNDAEKKIIVDWASAAQDSLERKN